MDDKNLKNQHSKYKWGFYYDPSDSRITVPKKIPSMGWTVNLARPAGKIIALAMAALVLSVISLIIYMSVTAHKIDIDVNSSSIIIDAPMYDFTAEKENIESVSMLNELPRGWRTNGYGGIKRAYGNFRFESYGKCRLYVYKNSDSPYIVLKLKSSSPAYLILNEKDSENTAALYERINSFLTAD